MKLRAVLLGLSLGLGACVTEGPPREAPEPELGTAASLNVRLGYEYLRAGKRAEAVQKFEKALEQDSRNAEAHLGIALVYEQASDFKTAREHYRAAVARAPKDPSILNAWGTFLCRQKEYAAAEQVYLEAARTVTYRTPEQAWTNAGVCARRAGDLTKAEGFLREALKANPRTAEALVQMAELSFERGDALKTRAFLERFLADHRPTAATLLLGWRAERALGDARAADRFAERLQREFADSAEARQLGGTR